MQEDLLVKDTNRLNARLSVLVLMVLVGGLVLAACGGGGGTNTNTNTNTGTGTGATATTGGTGTDTGTGATATTGTGGTGAGATATGAAPIQTVETGTGRGLQTAGPEATAVAPGGLSTPGATATAGTEGGTGTGTGSAGQGQAGQLGALITAGQAPADADPNGQLTYNLGLDPESIDPQVISGVNEVTTASMLFSPLLTLNGESQPTANAAESYTVSPDGKTYTFKIREGMKYSDGQPVTARNYEFALLRTCDPTVAGAYAYVAFDIVGCQEYYEAIPAVEEGTPTPDVPEAQLQKLRGAVGVKAVDDTTLRINLKQPAAYFPYIMTLWITYPTREESVKAGERWWANPQTAIGNGPFKLVSYAPKQQWVFERNEQFFRGTPRLQRLTFRIVESPQASLLAYQRGQLDVTGISADQFPQVNRDATLKQQLLREVEPTTFYIGFNLGKPPFNKLEARQAIAAAMNRQLYVQQVNNGVGRPTGSFIPEGIPGHQTRVQQTFDPNRAKQLLAQAGYPNGQGFPTLAFPYNNQSEASKKRAEFWSAQFKQILNINMRPTPEDGTKLFGRIRSNNIRENPEIYVLGWVQDYPHPQNWVSLVFTPGSDLAPAGWNDQEYAALAKRADAIQNIEEATPLYEQLDAQLAQKAPAAFFVNSEVLELVKPYVKGYTSYPGDPLGLSRQAEQIYVTQNR